MILRTIIFSLITFSFSFTHSQKYQMLIDSKGHSGKIHELLFTPDNKLVSLSEDKTIQVWDVQSQLLIDKFFAPMELGPKGMIYSATIDRKGQTLAYSGYIKKDNVFAIVLLNLSTKKESILLTKHETPISSIVFSEDGNKIASGDLEGQVILWQRISNNFKQVSSTLLGSSINEIDFSKDGKQLAVASESKFIDLLDVNNLSKTKRIERHYLPVKTVRYSPDGLYLVSGGMDNHVHLFTSTGKHISKLDKLDDPITSISFSSDSKVVIVMTEGKGVGKTFSIPDGKAMATFKEHDNTVLSSAVSPIMTFGSYQVASAGGNNNQILVWNPLSGRLSSILNGDGMSIWNLAFSDSSKLLIGNSFDSKRFNYLFDFTSQSLVTVDQAVTKEPQKFPNPYQLELTSGNNIKNNRKTDGRILTVEKLVNGELVVGSDFSLKMYDKTGTLTQELIGHEAGVRSLALSPNGKILVSASEDQKIIGWNVDQDGESIEPLFSMFLTKNGEWVMWSKNGYYSSSPKGAEYLGWKTLEGYDADVSYFSVDQYFEVLFRPQAFLAAYETGKEVEIILEENGERKFELASLNKPSLAFFGRPYISTSNEKDLYLNRQPSGPTYSTDVSPVNFETTLYDRGGGIKEFKVYHNDKLALIEKNISENDERRIDKEFSLPLLQGVNKIEIVATNFQNIDSKPHRLDIEYTGQTSAISDLYVFTVGVNEYANPSYNLNYAYADAKSFANKIVENASEIYNDVFVTEIYNADATFDNIEAKIKEVQEKAKLQDVFIFYYAGHGTVDEVNNDYYLVPTDVTQLYGDAQQLQRKGISAQKIKEWLASVKAQKQLVLLDACHSGEAVQTFAARGISSEERAIVQLARSSGTVLISASGSKQFATEFQELKHGAFTYALLEALDGKADGGDGDSKITVNEIKAYMEDRVPQLTKQYGGGNAQYPTGFSSGQDFPIMVIKK